MNVNETPNVDVLRVKKTLGDVAKNLHSIETCCFAAASSKK